MIPKSHIGKWCEVQRSDAIKRECLYCGNRLPSKSKEHVFSACWGGTDSSSKLVCDECNEAFGRIDGAFSPLLSVIMNAWALKGKRSSRIPTVPLGDWELGPYGKPRIARPKVTLDGDLNGEYQLSIEVGDKSQARRLLERGGELDKVYGRSLTEEERKALTDGIQRARYHDHNPGLLRSKITLNIQDQYRLAAHTALKCLKLYETLLVNSDETLQLREFARHGAKMFTEFAVTCDNQSSCTYPAEGMAEIYLNSVKVYWSAPLGKVIGVLTVMGDVTRAVTISRTWSGPSALLWVGEPVKGNTRIFARALQLPDEFANLPLLEVTDSPPKNQFFLDEYRDIIHRSYMNGVMAQVADGLSKIEKKWQVVQQASISELKKLVLGLGLRFAGNMGTDDRRRELLLKHLEPGFTELALRHEGKRLSDEKFQSDFAEIIQKLQCYISERSLSNPT